MNPRRRPEAPRRCTGAQNRERFVDSSQYLEEAECVVRDPERRDVREDIILVCTLSA